jgi:hypothetical protein
MIIGPAAPTACESKPSINATNAQMPMMTNW